jgi:hypothetical protein
MSPCCVVWCIGMHCSVALRKASGISRLYPEAFVQHGLIKRTTWKTRDIEKPTFSTLDVDLKWKMAADNENE